MLERYLIQHCSPTLASLKTANLFTFLYSDKKKLIGSIIKWNQMMGRKGISMTVLQMNSRYALIYVYRFSRLKEDLEKPGVWEFLQSCGYDKLEEQRLFIHLRKRLKEAGEFPHEIGLFLGYPLGDVLGFIEHEGKDYAFKGYWKVYKNPDDTMQMFEKFKKCRSVYERLWNEGRSIWQLTVAA